MLTRANGSDSKRRWIAASILPILLALTVAGGASAKGWVWPRAYAESKLVAEYETTDPWALRDAREQLAADLGTGFPEASTRVRHDRQDIAAAGRAASPLWAHCKGVGKDDGGGYFARFWCRVRLTSSMSQYEATRPFTLVVRGRQAFRVLFGWH